LLDKDETRINTNVLLKDASRWGYPKLMAANLAKPEKELAEEAGF
jgi:hypothetical protein